jgi:hypothetical protein
MKSFGLLALCLAVVGCAPPYIADLDKAAALTHQMTVVGTFGPLSSLMGGTQAAVRFLPIKPTAASLDALNVQSGFVVTEFNGYDYLQFAFVDSSGQAQLTQNQAFSLSGADPNYPLYQYDVTTTTSTANIIVFTLNPTSPASSSSSIYTGSLPSGQLASTATEMLNVVVGTLDALGVSVSPNPSSPDTVNFLFWSPGPPISYSDGSASVSSSPPAVFAAGSSSSNPSVSIPVTRTLYYRNQAGSLSYASYFLGGQWVCLQWQTASAQVGLTGVTHRIDALLTTGDLLSTEGETLRLYNPAGAGTELYAIPMNGLQFCYEAYVGSTPYVFFSLPLNLQHGDLAFNVYAVPTSSMRGLGG